MQGRKPVHPDWARLNSTVRERNRQIVRGQPALLAKMRWQIVARAAEPPTSPTADAPTAIATEGVPTEITPQPETARSLATDPVA